MINSLKSFLIKSFWEGTQIDKSNIMTAVYLGGGAHLSLYFIYKYFFDLYENLTLRIITLFLCISVGFYNKLNKKIQKKYFPFYWHLMLIMALPFMLSFNLFKNNFHEAWLYWEISMMFILALYIPNWFIYTVDLAIGIGGAFLLCLATTPTIEIGHNFNVYAYLIVFLFSGIAGLGFVHGNRKAWLNKQRDQYTRLISVTGSVVHEMRNPLNAISLCSNSIKEILQDDADNAKSLQIKDLRANNFINATNNDIIITKNTEVNQLNNLNELIEFNNGILRALSQANEIINIVLADLKDKPAEPREFCYLDFRTILPKILASYGYKNQDEKHKVHLDTSSSFVFKAVPERFDFIIYNLLKNALYYLNQYPNSTISIFTETKIVNDIEFNAICVHDTGPGIKEENMSKLFDSFFTSGKVGGTGLGLAFCKKNMLLFGGDIICESKEGEDDNNGNKKNGWTKFYLLFPKLDEEELKRARQQFLSQNNNTDNESSASSNNHNYRANANDNDNSNYNSSYNDIKDLSSVDIAIQPKYKILIVDDQKINLMVTKSRLEKYLSFISCDIALDGNDAIEKFKNNHYDLILMDIQMPELSDVITTKQLRKIIDSQYKGRDNVDNDNNKSNSIASHNSIASKVLVPIIAFTSLDYEEVIKEVSGAQTYFDDYIKKDSIDNHYLLYRSIYKWLVAKDSFSYLDHPKDTSDNNQEPKTELAELKKYRILLAEDQEMNLKLISRLLQKHHIEVVSAHNGEELLDIYKNSIETNKDNLPSNTKKSNFDIILTDINMPIMNGDQASKEIRKMELANNINYANRVIIIALTGEGDDNNIHHFFKSKMDDYFIKGQDPQSLIDLLKVYLPSMK